MKLSILLSPWIPTLTTVVITLFLYFRRCRNRIDNPMRKLPPESTGGWPLIGHLFLLTGPKPLHITLSKMADKYGPIFSIRLGSRRGLIVSSSELAKECYRTNDVAFSNRPQTAAVGLMGYNNAMIGFSNYGPYWREMRKISVLRLLSSRKVAALGDAREFQIRAIMRSLSEYCFSTRKEKECVDMRKIFVDLTLSLMVRTVAGDVEEKMDLGEQETWRRTIREFFEIITVFTISDVVPFLKWVDWFGGMHKAFRKTGKNFDIMLQEWLEDHKRQKKNMNDEEEDFMGEMLDVADCVAQEFPFYDADTINKATCLTMMLGGTDTMSVALTWALSLLLNNPDTLKTAQQELDTHIGRQRLVKESDIDNLVYIQAIIKETLRLQPPVPVVPREAAHDCIVAGYHIPAGTRLFINTWKIQRDPRVWPDPLQFKPERFLTGHKEVDVQGLQFELVPFGGGRRVCPGISFALRALQLALASFLHGFEVETTSGGGVDMTGSFGTTNMKATPLEVCLRPRLSPQVYA
ncbi:Cytochrome P450 CYP2 subfamily [Handroanthus impetiginosus]|uniref:Flavonoid-6-hydroxylase n=1 Tax=Handroanthus impetiginosus TaxID=429701 RepID=A0A2G9GJN8_9LAMI|nr:Cytochrome P450 CYP2 subfamily [Handroanthus impetiginosus]